jgi:alkaline phosphatase
MVEAALNVLSQDPEGFFLMVEGGQIDWAAHDNDAANVISDTLAFDAAVAVARGYAQQAAVPPLIIVTADHETGGMATRLTPAGEPGEDGPFSMPDLTPFWITWSTTAHTSADVPVTAVGPFAEGLVGFHENTQVFHVMHHALFPQRLWLPLVVSGNSP